MSAGGPGIRRRFTLIDGMILIGVMAVGLAGCREHLPLLLMKGWVVWAHRLSAYFLSLAAFAVLALGLRRPRPPIRRVARRPGAVACFAVAAVTILRDINDVVELASDGYLGSTADDVGWIWLLVDYREPAFAGVVPICWAVLALGGRWRPAAGWIDGAGRAVGWAWIAWLLSGPLLVWLVSRVAWFRPHPNIM